MKNSLINLSILAVTLLLLAVLFEFVLRTFDLAPANGVTTVDASTFERVPGIFTPNQDLEDLRNPNLPHQVTINQLGYRNESFPRNKPAAEIRILAIGDSFTFGDFVDNEQSLPAQLEQELKSQLPKSQIRVINAGVGGSTIIAQRQMLQRALLIQPDGVLLTFSENDVEDLMLPMWHQLANNRRLKSRFPLSLFYNTLSNTATWNFALDLRARLAVPRFENKDAQTSDVPAEHRAKQVAEEIQRTKLRLQYRQELIDLQEFLNAQSIPLLLAIYPAHWSLLGDSAREQIQWVSRTAEAANIEHINLLQGLLDSELSIESELYLLPHDGHPSAKGYAVAAKDIARNMIKSMPILADQHSQVH